MKKTLKKIYIENYGCSANKSNAEIMMGLLERAGCIIIESEKDADIIIINTCIVKGPTETKILKRIKDLAQEGKELIISGCMPEAEYDVLKNIIPDAILIGPQHIKEITKAVEIIINRKKKKDFVGYKHETKLCMPKHRYNKIIGIVQISEGCDGDCSYCITRLAKGMLFSYPAEKIIEEVKADIEEGCREIWLTSQDCAAYEYNLPDLLKKISAIKGKFFVRLGMMNPNNVKKILPELIEAVKKEDSKVFRFIHIPVQSGNNEILRKMNRRYDVKDFKEIISEFRKEIPDITISTDIICGFPTETEEQFSDSMKLIEEIKPDVLNISRFWPRPGTPAESMKQIPSWITKERSRKLTKVFNRIALEKNQRWIGWKGEVLIDEKGKSGTGTMIGRNNCYKPVVVRAGRKETIRSGQFAGVEIKDATANDLRSF